MRSSRNLKKPFDLSTFVLSSLGSRRRNDFHIMLCNLLYTGECMCPRIKNSPRVLITEDPLAILIEGLAVMPRRFTRQFVTMIHIVSVASICVSYQGPSCQQSEDTVTVPYVILSVYLF